LYLNIIGITLRDSVMYLYFLYIFRIAICRDKVELWKGIEVEEDKCKLDLRGFQDLYALLEKA
jgi:hypothetical protein